MTTTTTPKRPAGSRYEIARYHLDVCGGIGTTSELARRWGISRERVRQLSDTADFPAPVGHAGRNALYLIEECDEWRTRRRALAA